MKIRRFVAKDMKTALAQIKDELGEDAVIMSNKKIAEGVELMAAVDFNSQSTSATNTSATNSVQAPAQQRHTANSSASTEAQFNDDVVTLSQPASMEARKSVQQGINNASHVDHQQQPPADSLSSLLNRKIQTGGTGGVAEPLADIEQQFKDFTSRLENSVQGQAVPAQTMPNQPVPSQEVDAQDGYFDTGDAVHLQSSFQQANVPPSNAQQTSAQQASNAHVATPTFNADIDAMQKEMASIRALLEHQLSGLMWQDMAQRAPMKAVLVNKLMAMGITENVADQISGYIPLQANEAQAWQQATELMSQQIRTTSNEIIHQGGIFSLVGPTGVGKTTTIAKLAARFAQIHGADNVALISTDSYRIAGFEQLSTYGRIIGCEVKLAKDAQSLDQLLQHFTTKKLVLIDTAGMGQRDMRLSQHLTTLVTSARVRIKNYLVLAANTQAGVMQENVDRFKAIPLSGCIFTKLDESLSVGEILSTAIQNGLPIGYLTDGQRVPEDIKVANAEKLVRLADRMTQKNQLGSRASWRAMPTQPASAVS